MVSFIGGGLRKNKQCLLPSETRRVTHIKYTLTCHERMERERQNEHIYQGNPNEEYKFGNIVSTKRCILHIQVLLEYCYMESSHWENWNRIFSDLRSQPTLTVISMCVNWMYEADLTVYVVSFITNIMWYMEQTVTIFQIIQGKDIFYIYSEREIKEPGKLIFVFGWRSCCVK